MLMGVAEILTAMTAADPGTVKFIFPAGRRRPAAGETGARRRHGGRGRAREPARGAISVCTSCRSSRAPAHRSGGIMASSDRLHIVVHGRQTSRGAPWVRGSHFDQRRVINGLQSIVSRQIDITNSRRGHDRPHQRRRRYNSSRTRW